MTPLPDVFLAYQQRFAKLVDESQVLVVEKSRRTGFSWAAALVATLHAAARKGAGGMDVLYMGYNLEMAREFIDYVAEWARSIEPAAAEVAEFLFSDPLRPERDIKAFRVEFASGFKTLALPSVPRALRGMQGLVIIDEAAFHDDLSELLKAAFALLIWGGRVVVISTHDGDTNPFALLVHDIRAGRLPYALQECTFDDALRDGLYRRICLTSGKAWTAEGETAWRAAIIAQYGTAADEELFCIPSASKGAYLPGPLIEARAADGIKVARYEAPEGFAQWPGHLRDAEMKEWCEAELLPAVRALDAGTPHVLGMDFGRRGDLSVAWVLAVGRDMVRRTVLVAEWRDCPFEQQRQALHWVIGRLPRFRAGKLDATGNGMWLAEVTAQRFGAAIEQVMISEGWYRENMPPMKGAFEDGLIEIPRDREVIDDLRMLTIVRGVARVPEARRDEAGKRRHGDAAIALALAYAASRAEPEVYAYEGGLKDEQREGWRDRADEEEEDRQAPDGARGWLPALSGGVLI